MLAVHVLNITSAAPSCYIHHIAIQNHCFNENAECFKRSFSQSYNTHFGFCLRSFCWCSHNQALNLHRLSVADFNSWNDWKLFSNGKPLKYLDSFFLSVSKKSQNKTFEVENTVTNAALNSVDKKKFKLGVKKPV